MTITQTMDNNSFRTKAAAALAAVLAAGSLMVAPLAQPAHAAFPGQNGKIFFESHQDGPFEIYSMNPDGSAQKRLTTAGFGVEPSVSADGQKLTFTGTGVQGSDDIFVMNADGSGTPTNITNNSANDRGSAFSPDGKKVAFASNWDGDFDIFVTNADGTGTPINITNSSEGEGAPAWSPDGTKISYVRDVGGISQEKVEIFVMDSDGQNQTRLTNNAVNDGHPNFSPDGKKIAFDRRGNKGTNVYKMNLDGSGQKKLTRASSSFQGNFNPAFSPDGRKIAFMTNREGPIEIYTMNKDGSKEKKTTNLSKLDLRLDWGVSRQ
jgi:TolB protein